MNDTQFQEEEQKSQSRRNKTIAAVIVLAIAGAYFLTASSQSWWPFGDEEEFTEDTIPEEEISQEPIERPIIDGGDNSEEKLGVDLGEPESSSIAGALNNYGKAPPRTGAGGWLAASAAAIITLIYALMRKGVRKNWQT